MEEKPQFRSVGIGYVAHNKPRNTHEVRIWLAEELPLLNNELREGSEKRRVGGVDNDGNTQVFEINESATSVARWKGDTNRASSPDVRRGERVEVYKLGDSDIYYWDSLGWDEHLRRLETILLVVNADPSGGNVMPNIDNSYSLEVSSHDKHITLRTSQKNGERCRYTVQINTGSGTFTLEDDIGNYIHLDSRSRHWKWTNASGSYMELKKRDINIVAPSTINVTFDVCNMKGSELNIDVPKINVKGHTKHTGKFDIDGATTIVQGATIDKLDAASLTGGSGGGVTKIEGSLEVKKGTSLQQSLDVNGTVTADAFNNN